MPKTDKTVSALFMEKVDLAKRFGVSTTIISQVRNGKRWRSENANARAAERIR